MPLQPKFQHVPVFQKTIAAATTVVNTAARLVDGAFRTLTVDRLQVRGNAAVGSGLTVVTDASVAGHSLPRGTLGYAPVTTTQGPTAPPFDITGMTATVKIPGGRRLQVSVQPILASSANSDTIQVEIKEGSTVLQTANFPADSNAQAYTMPFSVVITPTAGTHTYKVTVVSASGNVTSNGSSTFPAFLLVEDIGV